MKRINEIFYSIQGEGYFAGRPAVFIRFSGCNLRCSFCDTRHQSGIMMSDEEIVSQAKRYPSRMVVITGGEPSLFLDGPLVDLLHSEGFFISVETNGTGRIPLSVDHITCSPKFEFCKGADIVLDRIDELKVVWTEDNDMSLYEGIKATHRFLQPCDTGDPVRNAHIRKTAFDWCLDHPEWRMSLQLHKILDVR